jgi:tRNA nucleotidyltransferase (CCA-adding enzyme)
MQLTVSHNNMDFDSLAAQFGVTKLYPTARMVLGSPVVGNVRKFVSLYRSSLPIVQAKYVDLESVSKIFIVDCQHIERLESTIKKLLKEGRPYTIFDHHQFDAEGLGSNAQSDSIIEPVGAATTLLVELIKERAIKLEPFEATLLAIGIYEDTGCLTFNRSSARDAAAVAFLLENKADITIINEYIRDQLSKEQLTLFQDLIEKAELLEISGKRIIIATTSMPKYLDGLAVLTRKLVEVESADAAFSIVHMRDRVHIVARSDTSAIDVRDIAHHFSGGGHQGAAAAVVKGGDLEQVAAEVRQLLHSSVKPERTASELMISPVRTIRPNISMEEAGRLMIRYGLDGLIVAEDDKVVGVVSRRDVDQATHHKLGHAKVSGFMSHPVISVKPQTTLSEIQQLIAQNDIGRLPVMDKHNRLLGLVSRRDVLDSLYNAVDPPEVAYPGFGIASGAEAPTTIAPSQKRVVDLRSKLGGLDENNYWLYRTIGEAAAEQNMSAYAVGGSVRDLILGLSHFDLDFVIEGSAMELAKVLEQKHPDKFKLLSIHERFQTASLQYLADKSKEIDLSTARTEFYEFPAALPTVEPSALEQDLFRRDFTINTLALCLNPDKFGMLIDYFNGLEDLKAGLIRILHQFSFIEDPTRILRAARFASRFQFALDDNTFKQAKRAISMGIFDNLAGVRMNTELRFILESPNRMAGLDILARLGGKLRYLDEELEYGAPESRLIRRAERLLRRFRLQEAWVVYLALLLSRLSNERVRNVVNRLHLTNDEKYTIEHGLALHDQLASISHGFTEKLKNSQVYFCLHGLKDESFAIAACLALPGSPVRRLIKTYADELRNVAIELAGADLLKLGFSEGPDIGKALQLILAAKLDGLVASREDEIAYVQTLRLAQDA